MAAGAIVVWTPPRTTTALTTAQTSLLDGAQVGEVGAAVVAGAAEVAALVLVQVVHAAHAQHAQEAVKVDLVRVCTRQRQRSVEMLQHHLPCPTSANACLRFALEWSCRTCLVAAAFHGAQRRPGESSTGSFAAHCLHCVPRAHSRAQTRQPLQSAAHAKLSSG